MLLFLALYVNLKGYQTNQQSYINVCIETCGSTTCISYAYEIRREDNIQQILRLKEIKSILINYVIEYYFTCEFLFLFLYFQEEVRWKLILDVVQHLLQ